MTAPTEISAAARLTTMFPNVPTTYEPVFTEDDVRKVIRLVARIASMRAPPPVCIRAMMDGLIELVGATYWTWIIIRVHPGERHPMFIACLDNFPDHIKQCLVNSTLDPEGPDPNMPRMATEVLTGHHITRTRQQLLSDAEWYLSNHYKKYRAPGKLDHCMHSVCPLKLGETSLCLSMGLHRLRCDQPFSERERLLAHLLLTEADWLRTALVPKGEGTQFQCLTPRERQALMYLLDGSSAKQIALKMRVSIHRVHDYTKAIHKRYGVSSRSELFALFLSGQSSPNTPALGVSDLVS